MDGLARIIRTYKENPQFIVEDVLASFHGRVDSELYLPEVKYDALTEFYGLPKNDFREKVAVLANPEALEDNFKHTKLTGLHLLMFARQMQENLVIENLSFSLRQLG